MKRFRIVLDGRRTYFGSFPTYWDAIADGIERGARGVSARIVPDPQG